MTDTSKEAVERCEAGCVAYHGGERRHHRDCVFYPESMTKMLDDCEADRDALKAEIKRLRGVLALYSKDENWRLNGPLDANSPRFEGVDRARQALKGSPQ